MKAGRARQDKYQPQDESKVQFWICVDEVMEFCSEYQEMSELAGKLGLTQNHLDALTNGDGVFSSGGGTVAMAGFGDEQMAGVLGSAAPAAPAAGAVRRTQRQQRVPGGGSGDGSIESACRQQMKKLVAAVADCRKLRMELSSAVESVDTGCAELVPKIDACAVSMDEAQDNQQNKQHQHKEPAHLLSAVKSLFLLLSGV